MTIRIYPLFLVVVLFCFNGRVMGQTDEEKIHFAAIKQSQIAKAAFKPTAGTDNYDVTYHRLFWELNPEKLYIAGNITTHFKSQQSGLTNIVFDLITPLTVDSILQRGISLEFAHENHILDIHLGMPLSLGVIDSLTVYYRGVPEAISGFGSFIISKHNNIPILWTLSEPYGAREWWPCKQSLTDKIDSVDIYIKTPKNYRAASNGKLIYEQTTGDYTTAYWKHRYPIATYLLAAAVTNYVNYSHFAKVDTENSVEILNYVYPENLAVAKTNTEFTVKVVELFSELFIPYPFYLEKYGHAQFGWGGGMEHQTMSFMGGFSEGLITHELAHQWFGNHVTCASWQHIWVNEGFAVFCENVAQEHLYPNNWVNWKKNLNTTVVNNTAEGSIFVDDTTDVWRIFNSALTYKKGGAILQMLRTQIGDEPFFSGLRRLLTDSKTAAGFATAEDVRFFLEQEADTSLYQYFNDWYYGQGYPTYSINWYQDLDNQLTITLSQQTSHESVPFFALKVPILLKGTDKEQLVWLPNTHDNQSFSLPLDFTINQIVFDPNYDIIAPHPANITLSVEETIYNHNIVIMPNPANSQISIKASNHSWFKKLDVIDNQGVRVLSVAFEKAIQKYELNISMLPNGVYYVRFDTNSGTVVKKLVKN